MTKEYLNGWTKETVIEHVNKHFKGQSLLHEGEIICAYRGADNKKCIAGCFIPDDLYEEGMENERVSTVMAMYPKLNKLMPFDSYYMRKWQDIHDNFTLMDELGTVDKQKKRLLGFLEE